MSGTYCCAAVVTVGLRVPTTDVLCWCCVAGLVLACCCCISSLTHCSLQLYIFDGKQLWDIERWMQYFHEYVGRCFDFYHAVVGVVMYHRSNYLWILLLYCCDCCWRWWWCFVLVLLYLLLLLLMLLLQLFWGIADLLLKSSYCAGGISCVIKKKRSLLLPTGNTVWKAKMSWRVEVMRAIVSRIPRKI